MAAAAAASDTREFALTARGHVEKENKVKATNDQLMTGEGLGEKGEGKNGNGKMNEPNDARSFAPGREEEETRK